MNTMISYCGLSCDSCPVHLATIERDEIRKQQMRKSISKQCAGQYNLKLHLEDITDCDGCRASIEDCFLVVLNARSGNVHLKGRLKPVLTVVIMAVKN